MPGFRRNTTGSSEKDPLLRQGGSPLHQVPQFGKRLQTRATITCRHSTRLCCQECGEHMFSSKTIID